MLSNESVRLAYLDFNTIKQQEWIQSSFAKIALAFSSGLAFFTPEIARNGISPVKELSACAEAASHI